MLHTVTMYTLYFRFIQETEGAELGVISNNAWLLRYLVSRPLTSPPHYLLSTIYYPLYWQWLAGAETSCCELKMEIRDWILWSPDTAAAGARSILH